MPTQDVPEMPETVRFPDVEPGQLAHEEGEVRSASAASVLGATWPEYLRRLLPPVPPDPMLRVGSPAVLQSPSGMADFLLGQGPGAARDLAAAFMGHGWFWERVGQEVAALSGG